MNTLIHADIFFFVTTIAVAIFTILFVIAWIYGVKILANVHHLSERARKEGDLIIDDIGRARERIEDEGFGVKTLFRFIRKTIARYY